MSQQREILVTYALTYANGPIHMGHLVGHIQTDIWVRFQKLQGHTVYFVGGEDAHGTPIMLNAEKQGMTPEQLIDKFFVAHQEDFAKFSIEFDSFYTTHSPENKKLAERIYQQLKVNDDIETKEIEQAYDEQKHMFLPDRYVKGECPVCHKPDQYGDSCENCGATYSPTDLNNPVSVVSGTPPILKKTEHEFFKLGNYEDDLKTWSRSGALQTEVANKLDEWFEAGLRSWDITRDAPYFGFEIPGRPEQYFYVWLDAPVGYMAGFQKLCEREGLDFDHFWGTDSKVELYHFIGKDITYFHTLFWPAMLQGGGFRIPNAVYVHGFLSIDGAKMSKSRGTFITAQQFAEHLNPEQLRYYLAAKLNGTLTDTDLNFNDFSARINADLVGKYVNIASRTAKFINKHFDGQLAEELDDTELYQQAIQVGDEIAECYEQREFGKAIRLIMELADKVNQYIDHHKPWTLMKEPGNEDRVQLICTQGLNLFRVLTIYLQPVLPQIAVAVAEFLQAEVTHWDDRKTPLLGHQIAEFKPLMQRVTEDQIKALLD